ncbi:MAG TPA: VanZ family protein [Ureibacillus sp.]|nr:VanZ family protein [Ureibacillus sp.]
MIQHKENRKMYLSILLAVYLTILAYFMFFGFGRPQLAVSNHEYRYWLIPDSIPLWLPKHFSIDILSLWIFALGNLLAFIPLGILAPMVFEKYINTYFRFVIIFVLYILSMEIIQMVTYLGSFDVTDIIVNTMGATIGFYSFRFSEQINTIGKKLVTMGLTIVGLSTIMFLIAEVYNNTIKLYLTDIFGI